MIYKLMTLTLLSNSEIDLNNLTQAQYEVITESRQRCNNMLYNVTQQQYSNLYFYYNDAYRKCVYVETEKQGYRIK